MLWVRAGAADTPYKCDTCLLVLLHLLEKLHIGLQCLIGMQELQAEVRKRQSAVLRPEPGSEEEHMNAFQRQKRLR